MAIPLLGLITSLVGIGKSTGLIKSPEDELKYQQALMQAAAQQDSAFAQFIASTSPGGTVAPGLPWYINLLGAVQNFCVSMMRPLITAYTAYWIYTQPDPMKIPALAWTPIAFWFTGRSVEKITELVKNGR